VVRKSPSEYIIFLINPGSTSTKVSVFKNESQIWNYEIIHSTDELKRFKTVVDQEDFRYRAIVNAVEKSGIDLSAVDAVGGRGGLLRPVESGVYTVNERMLDDLKNARFGQHASNLGAILARRFAVMIGCNAYIVDPVVVDEMDEVAKITGIPQIRRKSIFHALNQKSSAREVSSKLGKKYEDCNFIVAHMGGGISVGAHMKGRVVDVNNALDGDGPFSPERAGTLPAGQLLEFFIENKLDLATARGILAGKGGLVGYFGTNSVEKVKEMMIKGDKRAGQLYRAMAFKIAQEIAKHGATLSGVIDGIILTGGLARDGELVSIIKEKVSFLAPVFVLPGEREMLSLARGVLSVLQKEIKPKNY